MRITPTEDSAIVGQQPPTPIPTAPVPEGNDYEIWDDHPLMQHAVARVMQSDRHNERRIALGRMTIEERLDAGHVLSIVRRRHKDDGQWCAIQDEYKLPRTIVWETIEAYERSTKLGHCPQEVAANYETWTEVLVAYGVAKERPKKPAVPAANNDEQRPAHAEPVNEPEPDGRSAADSTGNCQANQKDGGNAEDKPARAVPESAPKAEKAAKKVQPDLTPCEIDAATVFVKAVGGWPRAVRVLELVKNVMGR